MLDGGLEHWVTPGRRITLVALAANEAFFCVLIDVLGSDTCKRLLRVSLCGGRALGSTPR